MRVVAGELGGRTITAPPGRATRPTSDKVRGAIFSSLASLVDLEGATVVDLFAGSGALGIEALSRGAAHATFVEHDRRAAEVIRRNLAALDLAERATVRAADALTTAAGPSDVTFADPPYAFTGWAALGERLATGLLVAEAGGPLPELHGWHVVRRKTYGSTVVTMLRPPAAGLSS